MLSTKPVLGITMIGAAAAVMALALYSHSPGALTTRTAPPLPAAKPAVFETQVLSVAVPLEAAARARAVARKPAVRRTHLEATPREPTDKGLEATPPEPTDMKVEAAPPEPTEMRAQGTPSGSTEMNAEATAPESIGKNLEATPSEPTVETIIVPCSDWHDLSNGPEQRHVRQLCRKTIPAVASPAAGS